MPDSYRVLHIANTLDKGTGVAEFMMNYCRVIDPTELVFDFAIHHVGAANYGSEVKDRGSQVYVLPEIRGKNLRLVSKAIFDLAVKVGGKYDAVHIHAPNIAFLHLPIWKGSGIKRIIAHSHAAQSSPYLLRRLRNSFIEPLGLRYATDFLACSEAAGRSAFRNKPFCIIPNAIDMSVFRPSNEMRRKVRREFDLEGKIVLGYVGRLAKGKNVDFLIDVLAKAAERSSDSYALLLVGAGEEESALRRYAARKHVEQRVRFAGYRSDTEALYNAMDVFLFPSESEGLGLVAVEAQACGIPCILSKGVPPEADVSGTSKVVDVSKGADAWVEAVRSVIMSGKEIDRKLLELSDYNIEASARRLVEFYKGVER